MLKVPTIVVLSSSRYLKTSSPTNFRARPRRPRPARESRRCGGGSTRSICRPAQARGREVKRGQSPSEAVIFHHVVWNRWPRSRREGMLSTRKVAKASRARLDSPQTNKPTPPPQESTPQQNKRSPSDFLKAVLGRSVVVRLNSGTDYKGGSLTGL